MHSDSCDCDSAGEATHHQLMLNKYLHLHEMHSGSGEYHLAGEATPHHQLMLDKNILRRQDCDRHLLNEDR